MTTNGKTVVLVADDEPSTLALVSGHLRARGFKVLEATDGDQAWELAHEHLPHLVMLDVMMPGMSGWEVCRKIREAVSLAHTGVIMLTGIGENLNEMTSPLYGADAYIDKPFEFSELDRRIEETLERRLGGALGRGDNYIPTEEDDRKNQEEPIATPPTQRPSSLAPDFEEPVTSVFKPKPAPSGEEPTRIRPKSAAVAPKAGYNGAPKAPVKAARATAGKAALGKAAPGKARPGKARPGKASAKTPRRPAKTPVAKKAAKIPKAARASAKGTKGSGPAAKRKAKRAPAAARKAGAAKPKGLKAKPKGQLAKRAARARAALTNPKKKAPARKAGAKAPSKTKGRGAPKPKAPVKKAGRKIAKRAGKKAGTARQAERATKARATKTLATARRKGRRAAKA